MVVFGKNWENFNSHPGNPRGYPKCTSTVGIPRPIAPPPHYPHPDTPWSTTKGYKYCGITAKHGVRMNFLNLTGIPHIALGAELWKLLFYLEQKKEAYIFLKIDLLGYKTAVFYIFLSFWTLKLFQ